MDYVAALNLPENWSLELAARKVASILAKYSESRGWGPGDYRVLVRFNADWDTMHFILVARGFEGRDNFECYHEVWNFMRSALRDEPDLLTSVNLVVKDFKQAEERGIFGIGPDYSLVQLS